MSKLLIDFSDVAIDPKSVIAVMDVSGQGNPFQTRIVLVGNVCVVTNTPMVDVVKAINVGFMPHDYYVAKPSPH